MTLVQWLRLSELAVKNKEQLPGPTGATVKAKKLHSVLNKNTGTNCLQLIREVHCEINATIADWAHTFGHC